jgi:hypothetical protein
MTLNKFLFYKYSTTTVIYWVLNLQLPLYTVWINFLSVLYSQLMAKLDSENAITNDLETSKFQNFSARRQAWWRLVELPLLHCKHIKSRPRNNLHPSKIFCNVRPWAQNILSSSPQKKFNLLLRNGSTLKCLKISLAYCNYTAPTGKKILCTTLSI